MCLGPNLASAPVRRLQQALRRPPRFAPDRALPFTRGPGLIVRAMADELIDVKKADDIIALWITLPLTIGCALAVITGLLAAVGCAFTRSITPLLLAGGFVLCMMGLYYMTLGFLTWAHRRLRLDAWAPPTTVTNWDARAASHPQWAADISAWLDHPRSVREANHLDNLWSSWQEHDSHVRIAQRQVEAWRQADRGASRRIVEQTALSACLEDSASAPPAPRARL